MKAAVLKANRELEVRDVPLPELQPDECSVKIHYAGVCSSDIFRAFEGGAYHYPIIIGHELAGEVAQAGANVRDFKKGDRVTIFPLRPCFKCEPCNRHDYAQCANYNYYGSRCDGGFADYLNVNQWNLLHVPAAVDLRDAALTEPMSVVVHALRRAEVEKLAKDGGTLGVIGAGFLGLMAIQIAKHFAPSLKVAALDRNAFKLDIAAKNGAETKALENDEAWKAYMADAGNRFDTVIEASGSPESFARSIHLVKHGGTVLWMGNITGNLTLPKALVSSVLRKEIRIIGTWNSSYKSPQNDDWKIALELMQAGIRPSTLVTHWTSLDEVPQLLGKLHQHKTAGKRFDHIKCVIKNA